MIVDDEPAVHDVTCMALRHIVYKNKNLQFIHAYSGEEAKTLIAAHPDTALILLDVVMESDHAGLQVVRHIREKIKNYFVRIVLRTGQPGHVPETEIILEYDINDYKEKTELTQKKLFTSVISCLRSYDDMMTIELNRRTLKEHESILKLAKRSAETANKAKTTFLSNMSHELLTPLNAIIGYSEIVQEEAIESGLDDFVPDIQKILQAGERLSRLYSCILNMSKIEADKLNVNPTHFQICDLISEVVIAAQSIAKENHNSFQILCTDKAFIYSDRNILYQILACLLHNAGKFTQKGKISLTVQHTIKQDQDWVSFAVTDTGIGIPFEKISAIFQPFAQGDMSQTRIYEGAGLGLSIAQSYSDVLGGHISVESVVNEGSTFTVHIPANILDIV